MKSWRWMPGMLTTDGIRIVEVCDLAGKEPDFTDPATKGCLLAQVREIHGVEATARRCGGWSPGQPQEWGLFDRTFQGQATASVWKLATSEIGALIAALEITAAP
jgi:hypothetical protein